MLRMRVGLAGALVVAGVTVVAILMVSSALESRAHQLAESLAVRSQAAFPSLDLLRGIELTNLTARLAREDEFGDALSQTGDAARRAAFVALETRNSRLEQQGRKADLMAVVGTNGHVLCRDLNINAMFDDDLKSKYPAVGKALDGLAVKDLWSFDGHMYRVGVAPIRAKSGAIAGALIVGYVNSAQDAIADRNKLGAEVGYFLDGKVQASSFRKEGGESAEEKALAAQLFDGVKLADAPAANETSKPLLVHIGADEYIAASGPLSGNLSPSRSGFVVLTALGPERAPIANVQLWLGLLGALGVLVVFGSTFVTVQRFVQPLDKIETGVGEVINGNRDYQFQSPSGEFEGLANGLNVMIARLLGRPDPSDEDDEGGWQGDGTAEAPSQPAAAAAAKPADPAAK